MNRFDEIIIFILLKICRILSKSSNVENIDTIIYTIEDKFKDKKIG